MASEGYRAGDVTHELTGILSGMFGRIGDVVDGTMN